MTDNKAANYNFLEVYMQKIKGMIFLSILVFTLSCTKIEPGFNTKKTENSIKSTTPKSAELDQLRREAASLLDSLRAREEKLDQKQASLDSLHYELQLREIKLNEKEYALKTFRLTSLIILVIGAVLALAGVVLLFKRKKKPEPIKPKAPEKPTSENDIQQATQQDIEKLPGISKSKEQTETAQPLRVQPDQAGIQEKIVNPVATKSLPRKTAVVKKQSKKPVSDVTVENISAVSAQKPQAKAKQSQKGIAVKGDAKKSVAKIGAAKTPSAFTKKTAPGKQTSKSVTAASNKEKSSAKKSAAGAKK